MAKHTLKVLWCEGRKIFKISLTIFHYYILKGQAVVMEQVDNAFSCLQALRTYTDKFNERCFTESFSVFLNSNFKFLSRK